MRLSVVVIMLLVLVGCAKPEPPEPPAPPPQEPVRTFTLSDFATEAPLSGFATIYLKWSFDPESVKAHLQTEARVVNVEQSMITIDLGGAEAATVTIRAGALDVMGARLDRNVTVRVLRPPLAEVGREEIRGGFRVGPYSSVIALLWLDNGRLLGYFHRPRRSGQEVVSVEGGLPAPLVEGASANFVSQATIDGRGLLVYESDGGLWRKADGAPPERIRDWPTPWASWDIWRNKLSPAGTALVSYGKVGPGSFTDLLTGRQHTLEAPGFYGSNVFDQWAPDGSLYRVQSVRTDKAPGFYFFDGTGKLQKTWHEPGYFSHWAAWSPDSRQVAFLSVPIDLKYPRTGEQWDELPFGPRLGVLDVATGKARYLTAEGGLVLIGTPVWSKDGRKLAVGCGELKIENGGTDPKEPRVCVADLAAGELRPVTLAVPGITWISSLSWSPDGTWLLGESLVRTEGDSYRRTSLVARVDGSPAAPLPADADLTQGAIWLGAGGPAVVVQRIDGGRALHRLLPTGQLGEALFAGADLMNLALSPDGKHLALTYEDRSGPRPNLETPSTYLVILRLDR